MSYISVEMFVNLLSVSLSLSAFIFDCCCFHLLKYETVFDHLKVEIIVIINFKYSNCFISDTRCGDLLSLDLMIIPNCYIYKYIYVCVHVYICMYLRMWRMIERYFFTTNIFLLAATSSQWIVYIVCHIFIQIYARW